MSKTYFEQCLYHISVYRNDYHLGMHLHTNPSQTLAQTLTLSPGDRSFISNIGTSCILLFLYSMTTHFIGAPNIYSIILINIYTLEDQSVKFIQK